MARRAAIVATLALAALGAVACTAAPAPEETAPPPTPLPELRTPTRSAGPTESPDPSLRTTPDPESTFQQLLASVPESLRTRCERGRPTGAAMARVDCRPSTGADSVSYVLFDAPAPMMDAYRARLAERAAADLEGPGCGRGPGSERLPNGRRTCVRDGDAAAVLWTNDLVYVLASAERADGDWAALETFWEAAGPITP